MLAHRYFAAIKDGQVLATTASATRQYRYALLYGRTVARWGSTRAVCEQQLDTFKPLNGEGRQLTTEIVDVVETQARLAVGTPWPPATLRTVEPDGDARDAMRQQELLEGKPITRSLRVSIELYRRDMLHVHPDVAHTLGMLLEVCK